MTFLQADKSEWRVQAFLPSGASGEWIGYDPRLVVGRSNARRAALALYESFSAGQARVECEPWDWTRDKLASPHAARFGIISVQAS